MADDLHDRILDAAVAAVAAGKPVADVVSEATGLAAAEVPAPAWDAIAALDTAADVAKASPWLARQFEARPMADDITGLWFGLYQVRGSVPGMFEAFVNLSGGAGFPDPAWPSGRTWETAGYAPAPGLRSLLPLTAGEEPEARALATGPVVFAYALGLVAALVDTLDPAAALGDKPQLGVVVGDPEGDSVVLGVLSATGLDRSTAARVERPAPAEEEPAGEAPAGGG